MKNIVIAALLIGASGYMTYIVSSKGIINHTEYCFTHNRIDIKLKNIRTADEAESIKSELVQCIEERKSLIQSLFFSKKDISNGFHINFNE
jgi:hypothetical protein